MDEKKLKHMQGIIDKLMGSLKAEHDKLKESVKEEGMDPSIKAEYLAKINEMQEQIFGYEKDITDGPGEDVTLDASGVKGKGPAAEEAFQSLLENGMAPADAAKHFEKWPEVKDDGDAGKGGDDKDGDDKGDDEKGGDDKGGDDKGGDDEGADDKKGDDDNDKKKKFVDLDEDQGGKEKYSHGPARQSYKLTL